MIRVSAPSRLHFGLFTLPAPDGSSEVWPDLDGRPALSSRAFGGVGLMVERPGLTVSVEPASEWSASGPLAERALLFAQCTSEALKLEHRCRVTVDAAPPEHVGLGTGTQLGLAVARGVALAAGRGDVGAAELAQLVGRGRRSASTALPRADFLSRGASDPPPRLRP